MSSTSDCIQTYIVIFNTGGSDEKYAEIVKILSWLKIRASKSVAIL